MLETPAPTAILSQYEKWRLKDPYQNANENKTAMLNIISSLKVGDEIGYQRLFSFSHCGKVQSIDNVTGRILTDKGFEFRWNKATGLYCLKGDNYAFLSIYRPDGANVYRRHS